MTALRLSPPAALALLLLGLAGGCGNGNPKDALSGALGPGAGGPAPGTLTAQPLVKPDQSPLGTMSYDAAYFTPNVSAPRPPQALVNATDNITVSLTPISGRPDTPCRFNAAVMARDQGYTIGDTGYRTNASGQDLYEVNLATAGSTIRLFCANLRDNAGMQFEIAATAPAKVSWLEVYAVLNSVRP